MLKRLIGVLACCALFVCYSPLGAQEQGEGGGEEAKPKKERKPRPKPEELTLTGKLEKKETTKTKDGKERTSVKYYLADAEGNKIRIPVPRAPKKKKGEEAAPAVINLDDHVDRNVFRNF